VTTATPASVNAAPANPLPTVRLRRRSARRRSTPLTIVMPAALAYFLLPLFWLAVASTKSTQDLFNSFGLWFSHSPHLLGNIGHTLTYDDGVFLHWLLNTVLYSVGSALGAALLATAVGYGFATHRFRGNGAAFNLVLGAVMIPTTAPAIPAYLLFAKVGWSTLPGRSSCPPSSARSAST
jgi:multiple sugar transport system permease protein